MEKIPTAEEIILKHCNTKTNDYGTFFSSISDIQCRNAMIEFAKLHVEQALKEASESRCINMYNKTWFAQSLEAGTKVLDRVNITVDKDSILNSYSLDNIK